MKVLSELKYSKSHEWIKVEGNIAYIGITDYAQDHLGEVVFADLSEIGREIKKEESVATLESVKAVVDIFSPLSGTVAKINEELLDNPASVNEDCYGSWLLAVEMSNIKELDELLNATEYENICK